MSEMKFEKALEKLEEIVGELETGRLSLDDSLKKYEEGVRLSRVCSRKLEEAQQKIEILMKKADGSLEKQPFAPEVVGAEQPENENGGPDKYTETKSGSSVGRPGAAGLTKKPKKQPDLSTPENELPF